MTRSHARILIRGTNWVGDGVITVAALREMRRAFPQSHLALLVKQWVADLFAAGDFVDEVLVYDRRPGMVGFLRYARFLRKKNFDAAILLQNAFEAAALALAAGIPTRIGLPTDGRRLLLTHSLKFSYPVPNEHQIYDYLNIVAQAEALLTGSSGVHFLKPQYELPVDADAKNRMHLQLRSLGWKEGHKLIAINPGASNNPLKRWFPDRFAALADRLLETGACTVFFVGAPSEKTIADNTISQMRNRAVNLTGETSLRESVAALSLCDLVISNDTGPAYISAALLRPTLTIFGPTNYWSICPTSPTARIVHFPVSCAPCLRKRCPTDHECMKGVTVAQVYETALEMLERQW